VIIAIDGPAGAGKSTVAKRVAERLGFRYLDTGAMYRALTLLALEHHVSLDDGEALGALARANPATVGWDQVVVGDRDVTKAIRTVEIDRVVSSVARHPEVREVLRERQRALAREGDAVMEGRDIGTVVCPDADVKVFLTADTAERARRRTDDRPGLGVDALATDLADRDARDAGQMRAADDAEEIDTTHLSIDEVVDRIADLVKARA
jgi:cytidylate kinase